MRSSRCPQQKRMGYCFEPCAAIHRASYSLYCGVYYAMYFR